MNFVSLMRNPITAGVLCITAGVFLYLNVVRPLIGSRAATETMPVQDTAPQTVSGDDAGTEQPSSANDGRTTAVALLRLKQNGWLRHTGRDPFLDEIRRRSNAPNAHPPEDTGKKTIATAPVQRVHTGGASRRPVLQTISIGAFDRVAIIDSREFRIGDAFGPGRITRIDADSIVIAGPAGRRILHLFDTEQGNVP